MTGAGPTPKSSPRERVLLGLVIAVVVGASAVPYLLAWLATPADRVYVGTTEASEDDYPTYLAKMRGGARGRWLQASPYAPELVQARSLRPLYASLGAISGGLGVPLPVGYHAARLVLGALALLAVYAAARRVASQPGERAPAFLLGSLGSGVGWLMGRDGPRSEWSYDLWVPELNAFYSLLTNPHFPLALLLVLACFAGAARSLDTARARPALLGGLALGVLTLVHTYDLLVVAAALAGFGSVAVATGRLPLRDVIRTALLLGLPALPAIAWQTWAFATDPSLAHMGRAQPVGSLLSVATGIGLLAPLALVGAPALARRGTLGAILVSWAVVVPLLLVVPLPFARRLVAGWHVPLGLAAGVGLARLVRGLAPPRRRAATGVAVALLCTGSLELWVYQNRRLADPPPGLWTALPRDLVEAYAWLDAHAASGEVVLASYGPSNWLPVFCDLRPYAGHWAETPDAAQRFAQVERFYSTRTTDRERVELLHRQGIDWVFAGRVGLRPGSARLDLRRPVDLSLAARIGEVTILRVEGGEDAARGAEAGGLGRRQRR